MPQAVICDNVNIDIRPLVADDALTSTITLGDLHGNAVKLLYFLVRQGVVNLDENDYSRLVKIYKTRLLTKELLAEFNQIMARMKVLRTDVFIRLIGDELSDRGANDYYTLKILQKLFREKVKVSILLSNHGVEFVEAYERFVERGHKFTTSLMEEQHTKSLLNLIKLVEQNLVSANEILSIAKDVYKPTLKLLDYSFDEETQEMTLYSHAGIGLNTIRQLARKFDVYFRNATMKELAITIESINAAFAVHVQDNTVHTLYTNERMNKGYDGEVDSDTDSVVEFILWNRCYRDLDRPDKIRNYTLNFVHGHDSPDRNLPNIINLDGPLGNSPGAHHGEYLILASNDVQLDRKFLPLFAQLRAIKLKAVDLEMSKHDIESTKAMILYHAINRNLYDLLDKKMDNELFRTDCLTKIEEARKVLGVHRGWKQVLGNLCLAIVGLGIGYLVGCVINKAVNNHFLFFETNSAKKLNELERIVQQVSPVA